jgi:hypothetical protein
MIIDIIVLAVFYAVQLTLFYLHLVDRDTYLSLGDEHDKKIAKKLFWFWHIPYLPGVYLALLKIIKGIRFLNRFYKEHTT